MNTLQSHTLWDEQKRRQQIYRREAEIARAIRAARRRSRWLEIRNAVAAGLHRAADAIAPRPEPETSPHRA